jgi:hypothetical protein
MNLLFYGQKFMVSPSGLKSRCGQAWFLQEAPGKNVLLACSSFQRFGDILGLWLHHFASCHYVTLFSNFDTSCIAFCEDPCVHVGSSQIF